MKLKYDLIELCCGLGAVTWAAVGAPKPPVSRIGAKTGYTGPILKALGIEPVTAHRVLMVDSDPLLCRTLGRMLLDPQSVARKIESFRGTPRSIWERCRVHVRVGDASAAEWLLYTAGARGGVGGYKGGHIRRPSVDGFIPSRKALAQRIEEWICLGEVDVLCDDVTKLEPMDYAPTRVYVDPEYLGRQGYGQETLYMPGLAENWRRAGHRVVVSGPEPLQEIPTDSPRAWRFVEITKLRRGQKRRSLTRDSVEWLSIGEPR